MPKKNAFSGRGFDDKWWSKIIAENPPRVLNSWRIQHIENEHFMQNNKSSAVIPALEKIACLSLVFAGQKLSTWSKK